MDSLDSVRKALAASQGTTKQVERVERERVSQAEEALLEKATTDEWDASWEEDKESQAQAETTQTNEDDEEDVSAWGLDEDNEPDTKLNSTDSTEEDEADDAWGWGDDDEGERVDSNKPSQASAATKPANRDNVAQKREVTLKEVYTVTDIPDSIINIVLQQIADSMDISHPP